MDEDSLTKCLQAVFMLCIVRNWYGRSPLTHHHQIKLWLCEHYALDILLLSRDKVAYLELNRKAMLEKKMQRQNTWYCLKTKSTLKVFIRANSCVKRTHSKPRPIPLKTLWQKIIACHRLFLSNLIEPLNYFWRQLCAKMSVSRCPMVVDIP